MVLGGAHPKAAISTEPATTLWRRARADEIASVIEFLLGPGASYVYGAQFSVDGGVDAMSRPSLF